MTMEDVNTRMLIQPKEIILANGSYQKGNNDSISFNFEETGEFDFLIKLCGFTPTKKIHTNKNPCESYIITLGNNNGDTTELNVAYDGTEAFAIRIVSNCITISAHSKNALAMGLKSLARLSCEFESIPCLEIQDMPQISFRGIHLCIFNPNDGTQKENTSAEAIKKMLITSALSGYNYAVLEFWGMFPYKKHPYACWPHSEFTREVVEDIISFIIDDLHMTPIPCQNLTSHAGWSRIDSRKHVVLDQRPDLASMWIPGGWCFATENPDTKAFLKDIMEDLIETYRNPPFFHVDCDKCFGFGSNEQDRTRPADALFMSHVSFLNTFLQSKGVQMIMWGDMLYSSADALYWKPNPIIADYLPKNIAINIWTHNDPGEKWHDIDFFQDKGYETIYSPFLDKSGIYNMINLCKQKKSRGILQTTWHKPQTAVNSVIYSGALQWSNSEACEECIRAFDARWHKTE